MSQNIIAIILARGGSKRLPGKNIKLLNGKPLIAYTIEEAKKCFMIKRVIVSTDDIEIAKIARSYGAEIINRPPELAQDDTSSALPCQHAIKQLNEDVDAVIVLPPTSPLRTIDHINQAIKKFFETGADSVESLCEVKDHPGWMFRLEGDKAIPYDEKNLHKRKQDLSKLYRENGAIYIVKKESLMKTNTFYGKDHRAIIMTEKESISIDTELDFVLAEELLKKFRNKKN